MVVGDRIATLTELQDRARSMVAECATSADHPLLQLVEELCREGDRITEEAKNDHEDLRQQVSFNCMLELKCLLSVFQNACEFI